MSEILETYIVDRLRQGGFVIVPASEFADWSFQVNILPYGDIFFYTKEDFLVSESGVRFDNILEWLHNNVFCRYVARKEYVASFISDLRNCFRQADIPDIAIYIEEREFVFVHILGEYVNELSMKCIQTTCLSYGYTYTELSEGAIIVNVSTIHYVAHSDLDFS